MTGLGELTSYNTVEKYIFKICSRDTKTKENLGA